MEGATTLCTNLNRRTKTSPAKSKGFCALGCCLLRLGRSEDHNLGTSTFPETAGLGTFMWWFESGCIQTSRFSGNAEHSLAASSPSWDLKPGVCAFPRVPEKSSTEKQHRGSIAPASRPPPWASLHPTTAWLRLPPGWLPTQHHGHPPRATIRRGTSGLGIRNLYFSLCLHLPQCILPFRSVV